MEGLGIVGIVFGILIMVIAYSYSKHIKKR